VHVPRFVLVQEKNTIVSVIQRKFRERKLHHDIEFEASVALRATFKQPTAKNLSMVFRYMDASGDGTISVTEFTSAFRRANMCASRCRAYACGWGSHCRRG
jgi:hypothetical protein